MFAEGTCPSTHIRSRFSLQPSPWLWLEHPSRGKVKRDQDGDARKMIVVAAGAALLIFLAFTFFARTPRSQLNVIQIASLIVFAAVILRHGRTRAPSLSEHRPEPPANGLRW